MKYIFVNRFYYPDMSATSQVLTDLTFSLKDINISIITSQQNYTDKSIKYTTFEKLNNIRINRVRTTHFGRFTTMGRLVDYFSFYLTSTFMLLKIANKNDVVIVKTDPPMLILCFIIPAYFKKLKLINWLQDLFPEIAINLGIKVFKGLPGKILIKLRNLGLKAAVANVAISKEMSDRLQQYINHDSIFLIPNWSDGNLLNPLDKTESLAVDWGLQDKFIIGYSGNLGRGHDYKTLLGMIEHFQDDPDIVFVVTGGGANYLNLKNGCRDKNLVNVLFKNYVEQSLLNRGLAAFDVHIVSMLEEMEGCMLPSKLYGIMAAGRPVLYIGSRQCELSELVEKNHIGIAVETGNIKAAIQAILTFRDDKVRQEMKNNSRKMLESTYDKKFALAKWDALLARVGS